MDLKRLRLVFLQITLISLSLALVAGCASSALPNSAANQVDSAYQNGASVVEHLGDNDLTAYPNSSGTAQGIVSGAVVGALTVGLYSGGSPGAALMGGAGGAVIGGVLGAYLNQHATLVQRLENHGAKVFVLGDQVLIVIPAQQMFRDVTPVFYPRAGATLDLVAQLVNGYRTMTVKVAAYTDGQGADKVNQAISQQQADVVLKYLWPRLNTRVLSAKGYGNEHLVDAVGTAINARIEITLEKLPV